MTVFIALALLLALMVPARLILPGHTRNQAGRDHDKRYCTKEGFHIYYDRKVLRSLNDKKKYAQKI